jgi:hypothetical protein
VWKLANNFFHVFSSWIDLCFWALDAGQVLGAVDGQRFNARRDCSSSKTVDLIVSTVVVSGVYSSYGLL